MALVCFLPQLLPLIRRCVLLFNSFPRVPLPSSSSVLVWFASDSPPLDTAASTSAGFSLTSQWFFNTVSCELPLVAAGRTLVVGAEVFGKQLSDWIQ
ncbi:hypothetical protein E2C01_082279 [Portunus trituberculatus]|uniref:Secreted protein n=1 Tax=Portunus trituberculatus TaxID=210409 RepID=A0A5B7J3D1_PORTR|nr:hypothetical protein [Portunus trituberculatus]